MDLHVLLGTFRKGSPSNVGLEKGDLPMLKYTKILTLLSLMAILALSACSPIITSSSGEPLEPVVETQPAVVEEGEPASVGDADTTGYQPVDVVDVTVEIGPENAIVANAVINYNLPDTCAQLEHVRTIQDDAVFFITLGTLAADAEGCVQDTLPQRVTVPLNIADLPVGEYEVDVNGVRAPFSVTDSESTGDLRTAEMPNYMDDVAVSEVSIVVGVGSPIPVHAVVMAELPKSCGQLGEVQVKRDGNTFFVRLIAELPAQTECNNDPLKIRLELPLNTVNLPEGTYEVNVNGSVTTFNIPLQ